MTEARFVRDMARQYSLAKCNVEREGNSSAPLLSHSKCRLQVLACKELE